MTNVAWNEVIVPTCRTAAASESADNVYINIGYKSPSCVTASSVPLVTKAVSKSWVQATSPHCNTNAIAPSVAASGGAHNSSWVEGVVPMSRTGVSKPTVKVTNPPWWWWWWHWHRFRG